MSNHHIYPVISHNKMLNQTTLTHTTSLSMSSLFPHWFLSTLSAGSLCRACNRAWASWSCGSMPHFLISAICWSVNSLLSVVCSICIRVWASLSSGLIPHFWSSCSCCWVMHALMFPCALWCWWLEPPRYCLQVFPWTVYCHSNIHYCHYFHFVSLALTPFFNKFGQDSVFTIRRHP